MGGPVAVQRRKDALVLRQRPEGLLPRLLVRQARRHFYLRQRDGGFELPRGGRAAGRDGGRADAATDPWRGRAGEEAGEPSRRAGDGRARVRSQSAEAGRRQGARISFRPRSRTRRAAALLARLLLARAVRLARRAGGEGGRRRPDDRGGTPHPRRGDRRPLRPVPRPGDVSDPRPRRQNRSPSAAARWTRAPRQNTSTRRRRRSSTKARCCSIITAQESLRTTPARSSSWKAMSMRSP